MDRKIKRMALFVMAAVTMLCFAACNRENENESPDTENQEVLGNTLWAWEGQETLGFISAEIVFPGDYAAKITFYKPDHSPVILDGTYSYSNGNGTMALRYQTTHNAINPTFTVNGNTMVLYIFGVTYTFTKQ